MTQQTTNTLSSEEIDLLKLLSKMIEHYRTILVIIVIFIGFSLFYCFIATPIYQANVLLQVETKKGGTSALFGEVSDIFASGGSAASEIEIMTSRMVLGKTIERLHLDIDIQPKYMPIVGSLWAKISGDPKPTLALSLFDIPESEYNKTYTIKYLGNDNNNYELFDPEGTKVLQGNIGKQAHLGAITIKVKQIDAQPGQLFNITKSPIIQTIHNMKSRLNVTEKGKQTGIIELTLNGKDRHDIEAVLNDLSQNYFLQNVARNTEEAQKSLSFLQGHLPKIKGNLEQSEQQLNDFRKKNESIDLTLEGQKALEASVDIQNRLNDLTFQESELSKKFTKQHPIYLSLVDKRNALEQQQAQLSRVIKQLPSTQQEYLKLKRNSGVNNQLYISLLNKTQELNIAKAGSIGNVRIIDTAVADTKPIAPKKKLIVILAALLGLISGSIYVLIRSRLIAGVENPDEIEALDLPLYATVPWSDFQHKSNLNKQYEILASTNPADLAVEALRSLRTNLHFSLMQTNNSIITITGPNPNIGKSFISTNLATVLSQGNKKVLLIDADLRKSYLHDLFKIKPKKLGLSSILSRQNTIEECLHHTDIEGLDFIARGQVAPNPSELLMQPQLKELLDWAQNHYDWILIDTPPILAVTDATIPAALSGSTLLVARFGMTRVKEIEIAKSRLEQSGIKISGCILNAVEKKVGSAYNNNFYHYEYKSDTDDENQPITTN